jgi:hypothetical protein
MTSTVQSGENRVSLSKSVLSMKFMKKKEEIEEKEKKEKQLLQKLQDGDWLNQSTQAPKEVKSTQSAQQKLECVRESQDLYSSLPGRRSFNGCNKAMEKNYQQIIDAKYFEHYKGKSDQVADPSPQANTEEIDYEKLVSLPRGPNQGKRPLNPKANQQHQQPYQQDGNAKKKFKTDTNTQGNNNNSSNNRNNKYQIIGKQRKPLKM